MTLETTPAAGVAEARIGATTPHTSTVNSVALPRIVILLETVRTFACRAPPDVATVSSSSAVQALVPAWLFRPIESLTMINVGSASGDVVDLRRLAHF